MTTDIPSLASWPTEVSRRFGLSVQPADDAPWSLALWCLCRPGAVSCAYGWAIPREPRKGGWSSFEVGSVGVGSLRRIHFGGTFGEVVSVLRGLVRGDSLADAARATDEQGLGSDNAAASLQLAPLGRRVDEFYTPSPWFFAPGSEGASPRPPYARQRSSPNPSAPALGTALLLKDKEAASERETLHDLLSLLELDTGLSFTGADAERLGDVEMFVFPAAHLNERPKAQVEIISRCPVVSIDGLPPKASVLVACTQELQGLVLGSETRRAEAVDGRARIEFEATPDGPHSTTVQIWNEESRAGGLWFLESVAFVRHIALRMNLLAGQTEFDSAWLQAWARSRRTKDAAAKLRRVRRAHTERTVSVGKADAAFVATIQAARRWASRAIPEKTRGRFFAPGGASSGDRLAFATWLREELGRPDEVSRVLILDPFFDQWGLELLARLENASCNYEVVTALRRPNQTEEQTLATLRAASERMDVVLRGIRLRLVGLRGDRPFHDRIVLAFDEEDNVVRGFHLSNSLDSAAKRFPLLVTSIGDDVLPRVADYVAELVGGHAQETVCEPSQRTSEKIPLLEDPAEAIEELTRRVALSSNDGFAEAWIAFAAKLARVQSSDVLRHERSLIGQVTPTFFDRVRRWLLVESPQLPRPRGVSDTLVTNDALAILTLYAERRFAEVSPVAGQYAEHWHHVRGAPWPVSFAFSILAEFSPKDFSSVVDEIVNTMPAASEDVAVRARYGALLLAATTCLMEQLAFREARTLGDLVAALFVAETPFLRALGAAGLGDRVLARGALHAREDYRIPATVALDMLQLGVEERILAVAMWASDLRIGANRHGRREDDAARNLRQLLMARMVEWWPVDARSELLREVVLHVEGPLPGGWADSTTNDLLAPLTRAHKVTDAEAVSVWLNLLESRMESLLAGSYMYFGNSDGPLTQVAAQLVAAASTADWLLPFERKARIARSRVLRPFGRARYAEWSHARDTLVWVGALARLVAEQAPAGSSTRSAAISIIALEDDAQSRIQDHRQTRDVTGLAAFAQAVRDREGRAPPARE